MKSQNIMLIGILLVTFFLRIGHLVEVRGIMPDSAIYCGGDASSYHANAQAALRGGWPQNQIIGGNNVPLYSLYLVAVYHLFGLNYSIPLILQMLLAVVAVAAVYGVGRLAFSPLTGLLAALAMASYGPLIAYQVCYAPLPLTTPLLILSIYFVLKYYYEGRMLYLAVAAIMLGLCILSRPTMLVVGPLILLWFFIERKSMLQFLQESAWFGLGLGLVLMPITLHNFRVSTRFIPVSVKGPLNFYFGNNPFSTGIGPHALPSAVGQVGTTTFNFGGEFTEVEARIEAGETTYVQQALNYITKHPLDWLELTTKKTYLMFVEPDWKLILVSFDYPASSLALKSSPYLQLFPTEWVALVIMALLALILVRNRYVYLLWAIIFLVSLAVILFFVKFRFRLPMVPLLLLVSFALVGAGRDWFHRNRRKFVIVLLILLMLFPFVPQLLIFIVLYVAVALFPYRGQTSLWQIRWPLIAIWSYVVVIGVMSQMFAVYSVNAQTQNYYVGPEIWGPIIVGQTFSPDCNGLDRIELELARLSFSHDQPYTFHLVRNLNLEDEIYSTRFDSTHVGKWSRKTFTFPPQVDSHGQSYFFYIRSPTSHPGNSLTVRLNVDASTIYRRYQNGSVYAGVGDVLQPFPADLAFAAYCQENVVQLFVRTVDQLASRGPKAFNIPELYFGLFIGHILLLCVTLFKIGWINLFRSK